MRTGSTLGRCRREDTRLSFRGTCDLKLTCPAFCLLALGAAAVCVRATFLAGFAGAENAGWINFGSGSPANGTGYANATAADFGVNIDPATGNLAGLAWGENIGWINFDTAAALGSAGQQARLNYAASRFRGYAWGENVGWINLDDTVYHLNAVTGNTYPGNLGSTDPNANFTC